MPRKQTTLESVTRSEYDSNLDTMSCPPERAECLPSQRFKRKHEQEDSSVLLLEMRKMLGAYETNHVKKYDSILQIVNDIKSQNDNIVTSMEFVSQQYEDLKGKFEKLQGDFNVKLNHIKILEKRIEDFERVTNSCKLEFRNISSLKCSETSDDLCESIVRLGNKLNISVQRANISNIYRLNTKSTKTKPIVVDFSSVILKDNFLQAARSYNAVNKTNKMSTSLLQIPGPEQPIYISEYMPFNTRRLFSMARSFARENQYSYCWTSHGRIYLRKKEGVPATLIDSECSLTKLKQVK